ncbi:hypothetical protein EDF60_1655 [Leucobacter luti]|uniref:hypothetical protein n=1 Tax=Leucobacter luti TaxID=340320 RepID=UPI0010490EDA|nr:hypothetical protein [Leucobacter luti]MCW2287004.1 hypothetical protein [Leucobacter luti]TCK41230.1 hypothetical protein EDF60_1655 [Leucobacter luti]
MTYKDWPTQIGGNMFSLAKLDPEVPPAKLKVVTWSNVFGSGGSVAIEAYDRTNSRFNSDLASIRVDGGSVAAEREHLQVLADEFGEDLARNWRALIEDARAKVTNYYTRQAEEQASKRDAALKGEFN